MNKTIKTLKAMLAIAISGMVFAPVAEAATVKEFYAMPENRQFSYLTETINGICDKLQDKYDRKGRLKSPELLKKQKEFAYFIIKIFEEEDSKGLRVGYAKLDSLIYSASLDEKDSQLSIERIILAFTMQRYEEHQAALNKPAPAAP